MDKCPHCGAKILYQGLNDLECASAKGYCPNGSVKPVDWRELIRRKIEDLRRKEVEKDKDNQTFRFFGNFPNPKDTSSGNSPYPSPRSYQKYQKARDAAQDEEVNQDLLDEMDELIESLDSDPDDGKTKITQNGDVKSVSYP